jgi:sigma-B regulation protein RsbU (phosphoserine phosphatase)
MTSLFVGVLDASAHRLSYCNAGHPLPILLREHEVVPLAGGGPVLGAIADGSFKAEVIGFKPGDTLVCYSDGLTEARGANGDEFGIERLVSAARKAVSCAPHTLLFSIIGEVQDFVGTRRRDDDMSLLVVQRSGLDDNRDI